MGFTIYKDPNFDKNLEELKQKGGIAAEAARKAQEVIYRLSSEEVPNPNAVCRYTYNGEHRIKNCRKFDLGGGYRLVFIKQGNCLVLCYIGDHDNCFRWIERNKKLKYKIDELTDAISVVLNNEEESEIPVDVVQEQMFVDEYERNIITRLDSPGCQRLLAEWFSGNRNL